jgi:DNA-binding winged helix-turn-helix (wHTH) protein
METSPWRAFDRFELNLQTGELKSRGVAVPLERQPAMALVRLVADRGQLVSRDDLRRAVWGDDTHVDFDRGLNYCLRQVRLALGDDARSPRFIETVPRQGYRFLIPVTAAGPRSGQASHRSWKLRAAVVALLVMAGAVVSELGGRNETHHQIAVAIARSLHDVLF